jgi:hypothetical protein
MNTIILFSLIGCVLGGFRLFAGCLLNNRKTTGCLLQPERQPKCNRVVFHNSLIIKGCFSGCSRLFGLFAKMGLGG